MTVIAAFCPLSVQTIFDANGRAISGAKLYFYDSETTNARTVYRDADLSLAHAHTTPVLTDGYGRAPPIYIGVGSYKVVVKDANGVQLYTVDPLPGGTETETTPAEAATGWETGDLKASYSDTAQDGWVVCNGHTIGNATSGATARADSDTENLFIKLWNANANLAVSGGRGANATADFEASKAIAVPDFRGRTFAGVDGMGASLAGLLTSATFSGSGNGPDDIGATGGAETTVLTASTVPTITTTVGDTTLTTAQIPVHSHGVDEIPHNHPLNDPEHNHGYQRPNVDSVMAGGAGSVDATTSSVNTANSATGITLDATSTGISIQNAGGGEAHNHTATSIANGTPDAHSNMQPSILCYIFIKL